MVAFKSIKTEKRKAAGLSFFNIDYLFICPGGICSLEAVDTVRKSVKMACIDDGEQFVQAAQRQLQLYG